uniref:SFRICE_038815 n=1 Tax=Spodoptera frugiperda TaxID=7108 RepID=A0A2H1WV27_SPOFR
MSPQGSHELLTSVNYQECSVFVFDKRIAEKLYKPKRKDTMLDCMRHCVSTMEKWRHPKMLQIIHALEEGTTTLAFASEPVLASLANILAWHECNVLPGHAPPVMPHPITLGPPSAQQQILNSTPHLPPHAKEYFFLDIELRYGLLQVIILLLIPFSRICLTS